MSEPLPIQRMDRVLEGLAAAEKLLRQANDSSCCEVARSQLAGLRVEIEQLFGILNQQYALILFMDQFVRGAEEGAPILFFIADRDGIIRFFMGKRELRQKLYLEDDPIGRSIFDQFHGNPQITENYQKSLQGQSAAFRIEAVGAAVDVHFTPLLDQDGMVSGAAGMVLDVTGQREAEHALQASETRFQMIFEEAQLGMLLLDAHRKILECNPSASAMLGRSSLDLPGMDVDSLIHPQDVLAFQQQFECLLLGRLPNDSFQSEKRYLGSEDSWIWVRETISLFRNEQGMPQYAIALLENINTQKQAEIERSEMEQRLQDGREAERVHLARELHDGPLQELYSISYLLTDIEGSLESKDARNGYRQIQRQLSDVTNNLRGLARELRPPALAQFGLEKGIRTHAERLSADHPELQVILRLDQDGDTLPERVRLVLFRIYQQSVVNTTRHAHATRLEVILRINTKEIALEIKDNGQGFRVPERWIELLREGHFGLVGSAERAQSIGGKLTVQSSPGAGTLIRVVVPIDPDNAYIPRERMSTYVSEPPLEQG